MSSPAEPLAAFDPLVPRPIDLPTEVPLDPAAPLDSLDDAKILAAPDDPADWPRWREQLTRWRSGARDRHGYSGGLYAQSDGAWTVAAYSVALTWLWDERLYDHAAGCFTPESFLDSMRRDFGGLDGVVLWHAYPVIGVDPRNQFDYYRQVPGLAELIGFFCSNGVRVFVDYNPWDTGTRRGDDDVTEIVRLVDDLAVDGVFLDTLKEGAPGLVEGLSKLDRVIALEGESRLALARVEDHALSWAQWFADSTAPGVLRAHWYERRHVLHHTRRWNHDHSDELQSAWMNGCGVLIWDAVFGAWVGWNARDRSTLRRMLRVQRAMHRWLVDGLWIPLVDASPQALSTGVHSSRYDLDGVSLWTAVNRCAEDWTGPIVAVAAEPSTRWFDVTSGAELATTVDGAVETVTSTVPGRGVAGIVRTGPDLPAWLPDLLSAAAADRQSADSAFPARATVRIVPAPAVGDVLPGVAAVSAGRRELPLVYRRRETGMYGGAPFVEEWKPLPPRLHDVVHEIREAEIGPVAVDEVEVSNADFAAFLAATGYTPASPTRFLEHWIDGAPASGTEDLPVTFVDLADARAYAAWRGARLPTEDEWQAAAQDGVLRRRTPLVWNWTESEHTDGVTRWAMLKGGSWFRAEGSEWYVDGGEQPPEASVKLLLLGEGLSRSECVGFRCLVDTTVGVE